MILDVYVEEKNARCNYSVKHEILAESGSTLAEAKYLCSIDPTCAKFFKDIGAVYNTGTYYKCTPESTLDLYGWTKYIVYIKGKIRIYDYIHGIENYVGIILPL